MSDGTTPGRKPTRTSRITIERFDNRQRRHSTLGYLSPAMFELRSAA